MYCWVLPLHLTHSKTKTDQICINLFALKMLLLFIFLFLEFCFNFRRIFCRLFSSKANPNMEKCPSKNRIEMFSFIPSAKEFAKGQLMEGKSNESGCQKLAILDKKQQSQQQIPGLIFCSLFCLLFDLIAHLFCLIVLLQMRRIMPTLPAPFLAMSFGAPYFLIYGSLTVAILYDLRIRPTNSNLNFNGI